MTRSAIKLDGAIVAVDVERSHLKRTPMYREDLVLIASTSLGPVREHRRICRTRPCSCGPRVVRIGRRWSIGC
jgi:hypothetical protein